MGLTFLLVKGNIRISINTQRVFLNATEDSSCWSHVSDLKVRVSRDGRTRYYVPDIVVVCDPNSRGDYEDNPCLVAEILSASTRAIDESFKASDYRRLDSLQGYLLVDSEGRGVEFHRRKGDDWAIEVVEDSVNLPCLGVSLSLEAIYRGVL